MAARNLPSTTAVSGVGLQKNSMSVFCRFSSLNSRMVSSGTISMNR